MTIGYALAIAGIAQVCCGLIFFRQPGVRIFFFGAIWNASKYLTPPGVALWVGGLAVAFVGIFIQLLVLFF